MKPFRPDPPAARSTRPSPRSRGAAAWALLVCVAALLGCAGCDPVDSDFFPLNEGNVWLYDWSQRRPAVATATLPAGGSQMWTVTEPADALARREAATDWVALRSTAIALQHVAPDSTITYGGEYRPGGTSRVSKLNGVLTVQTTTNQAELAALQLNLPLLTWPVYAGAKWEDYGPEYESANPIAMCRLIGFDTVETPAGRFFQCAHIVRTIDPTVDAGAWRLPARLSDSRQYPVQHFWLAPEIGLVKILYESPLGPSLRAELHAFHLADLPPDLRARQQTELDYTMDPANQRTAGGTGPDGRPRMTPEEMDRNYRFTVHDDFRR